MGIEMTAGWMHYFDTSERGKKEGKKKEKKGEKKGTERSKRERKGKEREEKIERRKEAKKKKRRRKKNVGTGMNVNIPIGGTVHVPWKRCGVKYGTEIPTNLPLVGKRGGFTSTKIVRINVLLAWNVMCLQ